MPPQYRRPGVYLKRLGLGSGTNVQRKKASRPRLQLAGAARGSCLRGAVREAVKYLPDEQRDPIAAARQMGCEGAGGARA
jgi:hypothetical protein